MRYLPLTPDDRSAMLAAVGAASIDDLFVDVPAEARLDGPITGLPNKSFGSTGETPYNLDGSVVSLDPDGDGIQGFDESGLDSEGLVALRDGTFWVSDEYGPHIVHFDANGKEVERINPFAADPRNKAGRLLPAELSTRWPNRGMEGLTITPDGKTLVALLQLGLRPGDRITVSVDGPEARAVLNRLRATITGLSAREKADAAAAARKAKAVVQGWTPPPAAGREMPVVAGVGASPGLAIGPVHVMPKADLTVPDRPAPLLEGGNRLHEALNLTRQQLKALADDTARRLGPAEAGIFAAQAELLNDTDVITLACQLMVEGHGPGWSWNEAVERSAAKLAANPNPVLAGRAADLRDVGRRVLTRIDPDLRGGSIRDLPDTPCILVADDLSPSDTAALDMGRVIGLATAQGGPTSHTAILARTLWLPAMVAGGGALTEIANGTTAILDGQSGRLYLEPADADLAAAHGWIEEQRVKKAQQEERRGLPARPWLAREHRRR